MAANTAPKPLSPAEQAATDALAARKLLEDAEKEKVSAQKKERANEAAAAIAKDRPSSSAIKKSLAPGQTAGEQTRGGQRLVDQKAPAGKELIGMRSGVPVYADTEDVYGAPSLKVSETGDKTLQTPEQQRAEYQAVQGPQAAAAMAPATPSVRKFFPQGPASQPEKVRTPQPLAPSQEQDWARDRATSEAREQGTLGTYFESIGKPEMAKAFPNVEDINPEWYKNYGPSGKEERVLSTRPAPEEPLWQRITRRTKTPRRPSYKR
jgi:hypothetical protein